MQSQAPRAPYVGLWTRLTGFRAIELSDLTAARGAVRGPLMRATLHLVSSSDYLALRPVIQPVLERGFAGSPFDITGVDVDALLAAGRELIEHGPQTRAALGPLLAERWPEADPASLAQAVTYLVPTVQVTPRGLWGQSGQARWTTIEAWLGRGLDPEPSRERLVLRYLGAFGPATVRDIQTWSGLTRLGEVVDRLRPELITFRDESGSELLDLPDAPRPGADLPRSAALPARVRQPAALARRPHALHHGRRGRSAPTRAGGAVRNAARRWSVPRNLADRSP